jgi:hypothetical protein
LIEANVVGQESSKNVPFKRVKILNRKWCIEYERNDED